MQRASVKADVFETRSRDQIGHVCSRYAACMTDSLSLAATEYAARRAAVLAQLKDSVALAFAGDMDASIHGEFSANANFRYLTGVADEPGAALLFDPLNPVDARKIILFLKPLNPELEKWDGFRMEISSALKAKYGVSTIMRTTALPLWM